MNKRATLLGAALLVPIFATVGAGMKHYVGIRLVEVTAAGNGADTTGHASVAAAYTISRDDVTLAQFTTFLNAVARKDFYNLYTPAMATNLNVAGILRTGTAGGSYTYSVIGDGRKPVSLVSWLDAARFCNWLHNGEPWAPEGPQTTETGAYTLDGDMTMGLEAKNAGTKYWIPTLDEWYKAAYYHVTKLSPYYLYPTGGNVAPGNSVTTSSNSANCLMTGLYAVTQSSVYSGTENYLTRVGAYRHSPSTWGTYDQGGDVAQWTDTTNAGTTNTTRFTPGGGWDTDSAPMRAQTTYADKTPTGHYVDPIYGAFLEKQNIGMGIYSSGTTSGIFILEPNPQFGGGVAGYGLNGDKALPKVEITSPAAGEKVNSNLHTSITFSGAASDADGVKYISYQVLYNDQVTDEFTASGPSDWTFIVTPGADKTEKYLVYVRPTDTNGNQSELAPRMVLYEP